MAHHPSLSQIPAQDRVREILKCGKDPSYFINKYVKIQHAKHGSLPFSTYKFQDTCLQDFIKHRFNIVVKSRQLGISTLAAAYSLWQALFYKDKTILVIATKLATAVNFIKKVKYALQALPRWLVLPQFTHTKQSVTFNNGSEIKAIPTSEDAGRSEALSLLIVDEAAIIKNFDEIWAASYPTLATGGSAILISTPKGVGGTYHRIYTEAVAGTNNFNAIKLKWDVHPDHNEEWFKEDSKQFAGDKKRIAQEYLCEFESSGDTYLQVEQVEWLKSIVQVPIEKCGDGKHIWVWKKPEWEHKYIMSADVSRGDSSDFSTFHIMDTMTCTVVAEYKGKIQPDKFAELLVEWATKYNSAYICPENNTYGYMTCMKLKELKYTKLFYKDAKRLESYLPKDDELPGFTTSANTKIVALSKLEELIRKKHIIIHSQRLIDEFMTYVWKGDKASALKGYHDDLVMSAAIVAWLYETYYSTFISDAMKDALACGITVTRRETQIAAPQRPNATVIMRQRWAKTQLDPSQMGEDMSWLLR